MHQIQSSHPSSGLTLGTEVKGSLKKVLFETDLFILMFIDPASDWIWCIWEYGVAVSPESDSTRFVILECTDHPKGFFDDIDIVKVRDEDSILKFVTQLLTQRDFIPGHPPLRADADADLLAVSEEALA